MNRLIATLILTLLASTAFGQVTTSDRFGFRSVNDPAYGAACGTTSDDSGAFQAALDAAAADGGGTVYVPACTGTDYYYFLTNIEIPSNVTLLCQRGATLKPRVTGGAMTYQTTGATGFVGFYGVTNAGIDGCTLDSLSVDTPSNQANSVEVRDATPNTLGSGTRSSFITVQNLTVRANSHSAGPYLIFVREADDVSILNNIVDGNQAAFAASTDQQGIEVINGTRIRISGNRLTNIGRYGIYLGGYGTGTFANYQSQDVVITDNQVNVAKAGVAFQAAIDGVGNLAFMEGVLVSGNTIRNAWEMGIRMGFGNATALVADTAVFRNIVISGNTVDNQVLTENPYGIGLLWGDTNAFGDGVVVVGNTFKGGKGSSATTPVGMRVDFVRGVTFEANVWSGGDVTTLAPLVAFSGDSYDLKFVGNTFGAVGGHSWAFGTVLADRFTVSGNHFNGYGAFQNTSNAINTGIGIKNRWTVVGNTFTRSTAATEGYVMAGTIASNVGWVWRDNIVGHTLSLNYQAAGLWEGVCTTTFATVNANSHGCQRMATGTSSIQVANAQARSGSRVYVTQMSGDVLPVRITAANGSFTIVAASNCSADCDFRWELFN